MKFYKNKKLLHRCLCAAIAASVFFTPLSSLAMSEEERLEIYQRPIDSDSWENWPVGPAVYAESAIVMEAETGMILYAKNIDAKQYPASITKIMTTLVALENSDLSEEVTYSYYATHSIEYGSSSIARTEGEILTMEESLYGLLLCSANECANAIAEHIAGSTEDFADLMNQKAAELGCTNTHFVNPNGLHDDDHYTSARDMALITRAAIQYDDFRRICGEDYYTLRATNKNDQELLMQNHHYMISSYKTSKFLDETVFAGKTGYTTKALNTLVTCATRNGMDLIVVTMKSASSGVRGEPLFSDTALLLDYADNFQKINIAENESTFKAENAYTIQMDSDGFLNDTSVVSIDPESSIILPKTASFQDAVPSLEVLESKNGDQALLSYTYAGQTVGSAVVSLEKQTLKTPVAEDTSSKEETKFIMINFRSILKVLGMLVVLLAVILGIRTLLRKNRRKITKAMQIYRKRRFNQRRRKRRRRF